MSVLRQNLHSFALWDFSHFHENSQEKITLSKKKLAYFSSTIRIVSPINRNSKIGLQSTG